LFSLIAAGIAMLLGEPWPAVRPVALTLSAPALALTFVILMITDGLGEELGWRGYLLPRLLCRYRAVPASLILGLGWWLWHLPLVWTAGAAIEDQPLWLLLADLLAKSLIFTYLFLGTQGSVLFAIMLHASTNLFVVSPAVGPEGDMTLPLVALVLKVVLAAVLFVHLPRSLSEARNSGSVIFSDSGAPR
jgi:membrane protease YdiL (CAAX protease family)